MFGARFYVVDQLNRAQVIRIGGQSVKGVGGQAHDVARLNALGYVADQGGFRVVAIDFNDFSGQFSSLRRLAEYLKLLTLTHHSKSATMEIITLA